MKAYKLLDGRIIFASQVLGDNFCTVTRKPSGGLKRYVSGQLPIRNSIEKAIQDLDNFASIRAMELVEIGGTV